MLDIPEHSPIIKIWRNTEKTRMLSRLVGKVAKRAVQPEPPPCLPRTVAKAPERLFKLAGQNTGARRVENLVVYNRKQHYNIRRVSQICDNASR